MNNAVLHHLKQYRARAAGLPGRELKWLAARRNRALTRFEEIGFPETIDEDWRYTKIKPITAKQFHHGAAQLKSPPRIDVANKICLVFVDGVLVKHDNSADVGICISSLAKMMKSDPDWIEEFLGVGMQESTNGFAALNDAYLDQGAVVVLPKGKKLGRPIELFFISSSANSFNVPRNLIVADESSNAQIVEHHMSIGGADNNRFTNSVTEIILGARANIDYHLVQNQAAGDYHISGVWARQAEQSRLRCYALTLGGALVRNDLQIKLCGAQAHCDMLGLYAVTNQQHIDNHTTVKHGVAGCTSREFYKGILTGRARAVFHGRIQVAADAQHTDAAQTNNNLLLSQDAEIITKPQLEIYADDVKCSHGATVGQLDSNALFYLRARGLSETEARQLLIFAFINEVINEIEIKPLRAWLGKALHAKLQAAAD